MIININEEDISPNGRRLIEQLALYFARQEMKIDALNQELNYMQEQLDKMKNDND